MAFGVFLFCSVVERVVVTALCHLSGFWQSSPSGVLFSCCTMSLVDFTHLIWPHKYLDDSLVLNFTCLQLLD